MNTLNGNDLEKVAGGMPNPVSGLTYEKAMKKAKELDAYRKDMGGGKRMSGKNYMKWWRGSNNESKEYLDHKNEVDEFIGDLK